MVKFDDLKIGDYVFANISWNGKKTIAICHLRYLSSARRGAMDIDEIYYDCVKYGLENFYITKRAYIRTLESEEIFKLLMES